MVFTPQGGKPENVSLMLAEMHYTQWFGHYDGALRHDDQTWVVENVPGVCERMDARF